MGQQMLRKGEWREPASAGILGDSPSVGAPGPPGDEPSPARAPLSGRAGAGPGASHPPPQPHQLLPTQPAAGVAQAASPRKALLLLCPSASLPIISALLPVLLGF